MTSLHLVDPELRDALAAWPDFPLTDDTIAQGRAGLLASAAAQQKVDAPNTLVSEFTAPSAFGGPPVRGLGYRPVHVKGPLPVILHLHGGGYIMGAAQMRDGLNRLHAADLDCAIYSVDYRLAPEAPYPAALQDAFSVLLWLKANAVEFGIDAARIGVKGESAGAGLAAGLALYARDQKGPARMRSVTTSTIWP